MTTEKARQPLLRSRMPELDTLRGVAVSLVLLFHGFYFVTGAARFHGPVRWFLLLTSAGWMGVNLFFVLSGFLITGILLESRDSPDYYRTFYLRRALRILPAYYGVLVLLLIAVRTGIVDRHVSWGFLGLSFVYLANVTELFRVPAQYAVLWSLAVEEHFYLLWPAAVRALSRRLLPWICGLIIFGCAALRAVYYWRHYDYGAGYTWLVADGLAWGALLAILARDKLSSRRAMSRFALASLIGSAVGVVALIPFGIGSSGTFVGGVLRLSLINSFFVGVLALAVLMGSGQWKAIFDRPGLKFLGEISYGLYLIHMLAFDAVDHLMGLRGVHVSGTNAGFALVLARFAAGAAVSVGVAYVSRWYYEEPFLRLKNRFAVSKTRPPIEVAQEPALETKAAS